MASSLSDAHTHTQTHTQLTLLIHLPPSLADHPEWATAEGFVHWDANPWAEPNFARMQGILLLSDHRETSGGFHCIPGFHTVYQEYAAHYAALKRTGALIDLPCAADKAFAQRITSSSLKVPIDLASDFVSSTVVHGSVEVSEAAALVLLGVGPYLEALVGGMSAAS